MKKVINIILSLFIYWVYKRIITILSLVTQAFIRKLIH
jgi:hypothetical protein